MPWNIKLNAMEYNRQTNFKVILKALFGGSY